MAILRRAACFAILACALLACGDDSTPTDGSTSDSSAADAAMDGAERDSAMDSSASDATMDTGLPIDSATEDDAAADDAAADDAAADVADAAGPSKRVFVFGEPLDIDDIESAANADSLCQGDADDRSFGGTWMAWISDSTTSPLARFTQSTVPYRLLDGTLVANDWDDLVDGTLAHPIDLTSGLSTIAFGYAATGTTPEGTPFGTSEERCDDWTDASSGITVSGNMTASDADWTAATARNCYTLHRLYCFEQ